MRIPHRSLALGAAGLVAGAALGLTGLANAADPTPSPSQGAQPEQRPGFDRHGGKGFGKGFDKGFGMRHGMPGGYGGLVTAIDSDSLTVRTPQGAETITLSSSTQYYEGRSKAARSAVDKGDVVHVRVADPRATTKVAAVVTVVPAHLSGWVTKVGSDELTITDHDGFTRTVRTTGSTTYEKDGATATRSAITVGAFVHAVGEVGDDGTTLDAERVSVGMPHRGGPGMPGGPMDGGPDAEPGSFPQA